MKIPPTAGRNSLFPVWLLRSKVSPTRQRVDLMERQSLTLKLHQSLDATLSLIHAPAGYGKSTLLSSWRQMLLDEGHLVCWLSLGKQDNDPMQLLTYIAFALVEGGVPFETDVAGLEIQLSDLSERDFLSLILHFIAEQHRQVVLILDDFENLAPEVVNKIITPMIEYAPDNLHISIATRDDTKLKISNLEAKGQAVRFSAGQLKFTSLELSDFLAPELEHHTIVRLFKQTEGWPVAIQMIRSAIRAEGDVERILGDLTGDSTHIAAYLSEEVLSNLPAELQEFLMDISLVDRVDCEFADYLRKQEDSYARLSQARTLDTLVLPVEGVEATYRLHPLFREHLYERLFVSRPARLKALHLRAADWFSDKGDLVEAVRQCVMAGEPGHSIAIVARIGGVMIWFKEGLTRLRAVIGLLDEHTVVSNPGLAMIRCLLDVKDGKVNQARQLYDSVTARSNVQVGDLSLAGENSGIHEFVMMEILISVYEGKPITQDFCCQLEEKIASIGEDEHSIRSNLLTFLCVGNLQRGRFTEARKFGQMAIPSFRAAGSMYGIAYIYFHLGDISFAEGNSAAAARSYSKGLKLAKKHFSDDQGMKLVANILISELRYELNELQNLSNVARTVPRQLERNEAWFDIHAAGYTTSANIEFDEFGIEAALAIVDRAAHYAELNKLSRLTRLLTCLRIDLLLRANMTDEAQTVLERSGLDIEDYKSSSEDQIAWRERDAVVHAITRLLIKQGQHQKALSLLTHFSKQARTDGHVRARMKYKILLSIAHSKNHNIGQQNEHLDGALALFTTSRFIRPFLDAQEDLTPIFERYLARTGETGLEISYAEQVQSILGEFGGHTGDDLGESLLSPRESEVLRELDQGFSNKVIARKIDVSESTVRFHLRNIFAKLNVNSRLQAVNVARKRQLI